MRGEYKSRKSIDKKKIGSPPLARGIRCFGSVPKRPHRITPACAGNTAPPSKSDGSLKDHPRLRGEYFHSSQALRADGGSPPLARGIPLTNTAMVIEERITPACAGNTERTNISCRNVRDHPRLRGEYL